MPKREVKQWITVNGVHIPLYESGPSRAVPKSQNKNYIQKHREVIKKLSDDKYESGTYDCDTLSTKEFNNGYQVTFCQIGDDYSDDEYNALVTMMLKKSSDGKSYAGKFEGTPEVSWHFNDKDEAIKIAKIYNQISIWDWASGDEIKTGGTGRRK